MREVKRNNPGAAVKLDYDTVEVGARSYVFSLEEGRVVEKEGDKGLGSQVSEEYCVRVDNISTRIPGRFVKHFRIFEQTSGS